MSQLESTAQRILTPMIHGKDTTLSTDDQTEIAKWAMKSAVVYDTHEKGNDYFFNKKDCQALFSSGARPFVDTTVFLAHYHDLNHAQIMLTETRRTGKPLIAYKNSPLFEFETYAATFAIKHLALQVFALHRSEAFTDPINLFVADPWQKATVCIWPTEAIVTWPPPLALNASTFSIFANRWRTPKVYSTKFP